MVAVYNSPDTDFWMIGHTASTIYDNAISLIINKPASHLPDPFGIFRPFCTWHESKRELTFGNKVIHTLGAKDKSAAGIIQGKTMSLCYCDEMTLYDPYIIDVIQMRLSLPHSMLFASLNPTYPAHKLKQWIDFAESGDPSYYSLHFTIDDNPFLTDIYKNDMKKSLSGVFYKRNYLGLWCLAEGAIFDFFDRALHVKNRYQHRECANYWIAGIDFGTANAFACVLIGVNAGNKSAGIGHRMWAEKEYYWDYTKTGRQKTASEFAREIKEFLDPYAVRAIYLDPSALNFKLELERQKLHVVLTKNDVESGIQKMTSEMKDGNFYLLDCCPNLIREVESYVWDPKSAEKGYDEPLKKDDHAVDALRYAIATHKVSSFNEDAYYHRQQENMMRPRY
jgi:PBSX family phage terminase large subunit